ncbi:hypothetical protein HanRHA438_Chr09g0382751 [Helianthus annuus]|uniref:Uncharacterized protein n=1 Tax=Helianthus annuus TaxID=4232 RepID=A0A9K3I3L5_HELAN|nr:hypothetical protein HanXRQr2_Chr09g0371171 [Helianthus annuus]KAJ0524823.1 hypothetical protein HanHA300_Chr09g0304971 [Helianthus annuus]KAJ0532743.1 hypothetical protein HanIR_Chr09g0400381 [Helianthus annuus]KAJ0541156.1 hypothetical protein HanHA89_Chr09g0325261 [Helianthus annuus]KAJ0706239.1 hypothetical protein HanLR1_Chr09g0304771 [Helianthus annuus]
MSPHFFYLFHPSIELHNHLDPSKENFKIFKRENTKYIKMVRFGNMKGMAQVDKAEAMSKDQVLQQTAKPPKSPISKMLGGLVIIGGLAYFVLYAHKKPEATALDVAKVATGTATTENTRPQK